MVILLPRLPGPAARSLLEQHLADGFGTWSGFNPRHLPAAVRFAATGGSPVDPDQLAELRERILRIARNSGLGHAGARVSHAGFDAEMAASFAEDSLFTSGEALRDDVWAFVGVALAPDVVHWRFGAARERYLGGVRNTFQRQWLRGRALDRGVDDPDRWRLLEELTEDALVQITERPSLGSDPVLARAIAEAWLRASLYHGRGAMEPIMRRAVLRVRIWNEIRSLVDLPSEHLADLLDDAFGVPAEHREKAIAETPRLPEEVDGAQNLPRNAGNEVPLRPTKTSGEVQRDAGGARLQAVRRIRDAAEQSGWMSRKSSRALNVIEQGQRDPTRKERNALNYLLERMRSAAILPGEVSLLSQVVGPQASSSVGEAASPTGAARSTCKRSNATGRAR